GSSSRPPCRRPTALAGTGNRRTGTPCDVCTPHCTSSRRPTAARPPSPPSSPRPTVRPQVSPYSTRSPTGPGASSPPGPPARTCWPAWGRPTMPSRPTTRRSPSRTTLHSVPTCGVAATGPDRSVEQRHRPAVVDDSRDAFERGTERRDLLGRADRRPQLTVEVHRHGPQLLEQRVPLLGGSDLLDASVLRCPMPSDQAGVLHGAEMVGQRRLADAHLGGDLALGGLRARTEREQDVPDRTGAASRLQSLVEGTRH